MVTKSTRPVTRETSAVVRDRGPRAVIVTIVGSFIELRAKGLRSTEVLDAAWCYTAAIRQRLNEQRSKKVKARPRK
jgi:hypothetical protein